GGDVPSAPSVPLAPCRPWLPSAPSGAWSPSGPGRRSVPWPPRRRAGPAPSPSAGPGRRRGHTGAEAPVAPSGGGAARSTSPRSPGQAPPAPEGGRLAEVLLDAQQPVVLRHPVRTGRGAGLDLAAVGGHGEVGDGRVLGLARTVRHHARVRVAGGQLDGLQRL